MTHECVKTLESLLESAEGSTSTSSPSPAGMPFTSHASPLAATRSRSSRRGLTKSKVGSDLEGRESLLSARASTSGLLTCMSGSDESRWRKR